MAQSKASDIAKRCLCVEGIPRGVLTNETRVYFTGVLDVFDTGSGKHVFLFDNELDAKFQRQKTPKIKLDSQEGTIELSVESCDASDLHKSWLDQLDKKLKLPMKTIYVNTAAVCEVPEHHVSEDEAKKLCKGDNSNQNVQPTDSNVTHPQPGTGPSGPGWEHYLPSGQGYSGQFNLPQSGSDHNINTRMEGNLNNQYPPTPPQPPHSYWYGNMPHLGFPPHFQSGMGNPPSGDRGDQMPPSHFWDPNQPGAQMPSTGEAAQGFGNPYQYPYWFPNYGQFGPPPPYEINTNIKTVASSSDELVTTEEKTPSNVSSGQSCTEVKSPVESPLKEKKPTGSLISMVQDEFLEKIERKQQMENERAAETPKNHEPSVKQEKEDEPARKIKVTKLPEETTEDSLMNFFENRRRNGGGPIEDIVYHPATSSAIIEFHEAEAVDRVLKKRPFLFLKKQISVEEYVEEVEEVEEEVEEPSIRTIEVCGFTENAVEEVLEMYFENTKRSGGGEVTSVVIEDGVALVTFAEEDVASSVCDRDHTLDGHKLNVSLHVPKKKSSDMETIKEEAVEPVCTIEVRGYILGTENTIELYFENTRRSGGDEIQKIDRVDSDGVIFITFASEEVARRVAERQHQLSGCNLDVKLYEPPKHKSAKNLSKICSNEPQESVPHCTIEVRGVTKTLNRTTLQFYFENTKRSGGDEIVNVEYKEENELAYITYESEEVAQRVAVHGQHKVEGQPLEVKLYIPPPPKPTYTDRVLLAGLTNKVTRDGLSNFVEAKIGLTPQSFLFSEEGDKVIITFDEVVDFQKLEEACKKRALEGSHLQPSKVQVSNCILVLNLKTTTTNDTIELYFENVKRSWGGPIEKVDFCRDEDFCLVYFEDYMVCDQVLKRKHKIDGSELQASIFYESLGRISEDGNGPFKTPKPVKLEGLDYAKMQFVMKSEPNRTALEKQLQDCYTQIQWPQSETDCTILTCTLTSDVQDCKKKALTWAKEAERNLHDFLKVVLVHEHKVFQDIFETVLQSLKNLVISNPNGVAVFVKKAELSIQVVGHKSVVVVVVKDIEDITKKAEADFDRKKKQTKDTLTSLKYHQLKLLLAQKYPSQVEQKFNGLKVKINLNKNEIVFEGLMEDIRTAQVAMYETVHNAAVSKLNNVPNGRLLLYKSKEVKDYIVSKLKSKKLVGVWEVEGTALNVYANSDEAVVACTHIVDDSVKEHQKDLEPPQRSVVQSQQWNDKMKDLDKQHQGKLHVVLSPDFSKLCLYFTDDILGTIMEEVTDFLSRNAVLEKVVSCDSGIVQLIERTNKKELDNIAKDLTHNYVQINSQSHGGFLVRGNQDGIHQAAFRLQELIDKVKRREHELKRPGIGGYMDGKGQEHINAVENKVPCVIQRREKKQLSFGETDDSGGFGQASYAGSSPEIQAECRSFSGEKIFTTLGDITELDADVLVNAADPKLEHKGGVAKAIVDKGGRVVKEECTQYIRDNGLLAEGEIHVTSGGKLHAKIIIHVVSPVWRGGNSNEDETLREIIFKCMEAAAEQKFKSIAFPALGAGAFGYPVKQATRVIADAVRDFFREFQDGPIKEVYLADIQVVTVKCFTEALGISFGKQCVKEVSRRPPQSQKSVKTTHSSGAFSAMPNIIAGESSGFGGITIKVVKGEMDNQRVDVIVNTVAKSLDLTQGAVSQSLLRKGGMSLQVECKTNYPNGIKDGEMAVTGGGNLFCRIVCHVALVQWNDPAASKQMLHRLMDKCLAQCEDDGFTSIAFPALGTGNLNYPKDVVAKEMFQHISNYSKENPSSPVTEVRFVVYHKDLPTVQAFELEQQKWSSRGTRAGTRTSRHLQPEESRAFDIEPGESDQE